MAEARTAVKPRMGNSSPSSASQRPILIIEDDPDTVRLVRLYLERDGHSVIEAGDGIDGLDLALTESPRLVVLDNCGHHPEVEKPDEFVKVVQDFLSED